MDVEAWKAATSGSRARRPGPKKTTSTTDPKPAKARRPPRSKASSGEG
jgi:hypothetical protein